MAIKDKNLNNQYNRYNPFILLKETPYLDEVIQRDKQEQADKKIILELLRGKNER